MPDRILLPTSKTGRRWRVSLFDVLCGAIAPIGAFALRDTAMLVDDYYLYDVYFYAAVSCVITAIVTMAFRLGDILPRYFSFGDAAQVLKASATSVMLSAAVAFFVTRLDNLPRPTVVSQFLILAALLLTGRAFGRHFRRRWRPERTGAHQAPASVSGAQVEYQNAIVVGVFPTTSTFLRLVEEAPESNIKVVLLLDPRPKYIGRTIAGYVIGGSPLQLGALLDEYRVHGVTIHRVFIAAPRNRMRASDTDSVLAVCAAHNVRCEYISDMLSGLDPEPAPKTPVLEPARPEQDPRQLALPGIRTLPETAWARVDGRAPSNHGGTYLGLRRIAEIALVLLLLIPLLPLGLAISALVWIGIGRPVLFWQQRIGRHGRAFPVYKFRTLKAPFDHSGRRLNDDERLNAIGRFIRATRLDELPQLYNVLRGDMSLIGPRPLLPVDLPKGDMARLSVRPGLTGWAQVNGGKLLSVQDKNNLDKFYIAHAGPLIDLQIVVKTVIMMVRGDHVSTPAIERARAPMQSSH
jgi:lipopolysaccharide/colanic/teichoic acid biosynthesis glycosyltransferase